MKRLSLIRKQYQKIILKLKGYPVPPDKWLSGADASEWDRLLDEAERDMDNEPLPLVNQDTHDSERRRRDMRMKGAIGMLERTMLHEKGLSMSAKNFIKKEK